MIVHLGGDVAVREKWIEGIFLWSAARQSRIMHSFFQHAKERGEIVRINEEKDNEPKSIVLVTSRSRARTVYISPISAATLRRRAMRPACFIDITDGKEQNQ